MDFDLGPLTWVKAEVDQALGAARQALADWNGEDTNPLKAAAAHLHQVSGALTIVDLQGVSLLCGEAERLLTEMVHEAERRGPESAEVAIDAIDALLVYLDELMGGAPNAELKLAGIYARVLAQRGAEPPAPSELFFPDVSLRVGRTAPQAPPLDEEALNRAIRRARGQYQRGLLMFLQDKEATVGLMYMDQAVRELERLAPGATQYTFWWLVAGLLESLRRGALPVDFWVKRLCGRIDLQMRRLAEGSRQLAERLLRDVLYYLAQDKGIDGRALDARRIFHLDRYMTAGIGAEAGGAEASWRPHLNALREALNRAKDAWMKYCGGRQDNLEPFQSAALEMFEAAVRLPNDSLKALLRMVHAVAKRSSSVADTAQNEALQLEMATAMLLTHNAIDHFESLGQEFDRQADVQTQRLQAAIDPNYDVSRIPADVPMLDEVSRQAQERLIVAHVSQEIQANLNQVEEILDKFFRDASERGRVPLVPGLMKQVLGAFNILQLGTAADLTRASLERIDRFADPDYPISAEELDWVAEALSTLGLYVEALRYGRDDTQKLTGLLARRESLPSPEASVEAEIRAETARLQEEAARLAGGEATEADRQALGEGLSKLARDADLVGNVQLKEQAQQAIQALKENAPAQAIGSVVQQIGAPAGAAQAAPSAEAAQLAGATDETIDAEMLNVYIEEANDVLGNIVAQLARLNVSPFDNDAFASVRRSFHTLKGSGRMVGLTELAEVAWQVEDTLNHWLRAEKAPTPELLDWLEKVADAFGGWVQVLEAGGQPRVEAGDLLARARALRGGTPEASPPPKSEAGAPTSAAAAGEEEMMDIGGHSLPVALYRVFAEEALQRLGELHENLGRVADGPDTAAWEALIRAAHTLAGISRTTGFQSLADAVHAVELWAGAWPGKDRPLDGAAVSVLQDILAQLAGMLQEIEAGSLPDGSPEIPERLDALAPPPDAEPAAEAQVMAPAAEIEAAPPVPAPTVAARTEVRPDLPEQPATADQPTQPEPEAAAQAAPRALPEDDLDPQLLPIFLDEAAELLPRIGTNLRQWRSEPGDATARQALQRALHTLKGSARMAGAMRLGERTHILEARLLEQGDGAPQAEFLDGLEAEYDTLAEMVEALSTPPEAAPPATEPLDAAPPETHAAPPVPVTAPAVTEEDLRLRQTLKLKANILDTLLNEAGEVAIARARVENLLNNYKQTAQELTANVERLRSQLRELEIQAESQMRTRLSQMDESHFDPLEFDRYSRLQELTRLLAESVNDVSTAQDNLLSGIDEADRTLHLQSRMTRSLQHELMRMRMVPFDSLAERLHRVVRQAAKELQRKAQLEIDGGQTELDRTVLDRVVAPLEHLLRNAVAHGMEPPDERRAAGKPEYGEIHLAIRQEGNEILITVADDGAGVNLEAVRARAEALGWVGAGEVISTERLESFLFTPGFSTAQRVTEVAGRGIGLDVVKNEIAGIGGRVRMETEAGLGTRFTIRLPLTLAVAPVVLARAGGQTYALPANLVALVREVRVEELNALHEAGQMVFEDERYPLRSLAELTDCRPQPAEGRFRTLLLLRAGDERLALRVDAMEGNYEAVIKNTGAQVARIAGIVGATVLGDGRIALILNPFALAERAPVQPLPEEEIQAAEEQSRLVLVVDDSLTVRKITSRLLEREGYRVATAKDGVEALEFMQDEIPAVMLLDIEMPRMDGFEVTRAVRADARLRDLPIIMITSRTAEKHHQHALDLGVNAYMGKPYQDEALLGEIARLTGEVVAAG